MSNPQKITIYDVAAQAGVSISTVSRVLNAPHKVKEQTRIKVIDVVDRLGFVPHENAVARARKMLGRIGVLTPFFTSPSSVERMRGIASGITNTDFELVIYPVNSQQRLDAYLAQLPMMRQIDGLIIMSLSIDEKSSQRLLDSGIVTVTLDATTNTLFSSIEHDDFAGGALAANHLLDKGHRQIAYFDYTGHDSFYINHGVKRLEGFQQALAQRSINLRVDYTRYIELYADESTMQNQIENHLDELLQSLDAPTAIFASADALALRILRAARQRNIHVPDDLAIIGYDNIEFASYIGLTTIDQLIQQTGELAVEILIRQMQGQSNILQQTSVNMRVVERETT